MDLAVTIDDSAKGAHRGLHPNRVEVDVEPQPLLRGRASRHRPEDAVDGITLQSRAVVIYDLYRNPSQRTMSGGTWMSS